MNYTHLLVAGDAEFALRNFHPLRCIATTKTGRRCLAAVHEPCPIKWSDLHAQVGTVPGGDADAWRIQRCWAHTTSSRRDFCQPEAIELPRGTIARVLRGEIFVAVARAQP